MNNIIKVDTDNVSFRNYLGTLTPVLKRMYSFGFRIHRAEVYNTKNGYHIYYRLNNSVNFESTIILELLLGNDKLRSVYTYFEGKDILFKRKKNVLRKKNKYLTTKLNNYLNVLGKYYVDNNYIKAVVTF